MPNTESAPPEYSLIKDNPGDIWKLLYNAKRVLGFWVVNLTVSVVTSGAMFAMLNCWTPLMLVTVLVWYAPSSPALNISRISVSYFFPPLLS